MKIEAIDIGEDDEDEDELVVLTCPNCSRPFTLGVDGAHNRERGLEECDRCAGVQRDKVGYAWCEGENETEFSDGSIVTREVAFSRDYLEELERGDFKPKQDAPTVKLVIGLTCTQEGDDLILSMGHEAFLLEGKPKNAPEIVFARWLVRALPEFYKYWAENGGYELVIIDDTETTVVDGDIDEGSCGRDCSCAEPKC